MPGATGLLTKLTRGNMYFYDSKTKQNEQNILLEVRSYSCFNYGFSKCFFVTRSNYGTII